MFSEYVSLGHPDKMADYISEKILDYYISHDPKVRYAVECQVKNDVVNLAGEVSSTYRIDYSTICDLVKEAIREIGYTEEYANKWDNMCINPLKLEIHEFIHKQSPDISIGVDREGWGDQGIFFGYAVNNYKTNYMPEDHYIAKLLGTTLYEKVKNNELPNAGLDIKTQVGIKDKKLKQIIVAIPMLDNDLYSIEKIVQRVLEDCIDDNIVEGFTEDFNIVINGTGIYKVHSSVGDCGITGRKLAVDFYGGNCKIGGGSCWTKDGTKADLTLNLYARKLALLHIKNTPRCKTVETQLSCCIGRKTVNINILEDNQLVYEGQLELGTSSLIEMFSLNTPIFTSLCKDGLFSKIK